jgi:hypothetical protein
MKPNWVAIIFGVVVVAASFSISFVKGAEAAARDAVQINQPHIAQTR